MEYFGEDYRVAAISTISLTVIGINMPCLRSVGQFKMPSLMTIAIHYRQTDINCMKASSKIIYFSD